MSIYLFPVESFVFFRVLEKNSIIHILFEERMPTISHF